MKLKYTIGLIILLSLFSCKDDEFQKSSDVKPIDWENYNTVYDTYWNFAGECEDADPSLDGKTIKVMGYIHRPFGELKPSLFRIIDDPEDIFKPIADIGKSVHIKSFDTVVNALKEKFDTVDLMKKCYIEGELFQNRREIGSGCKISPNIFVEKSEDVIFK